MKKTAYILVNFGGPRNLTEVKPFLKALLTDEDVIHPKLPSFLHRIMFSQIATKRAKTITHDYIVIGGSSPIFADTEALAEQLRQQGLSPLLTFHRYLTKTHAPFLKTIQQLDVDEILLFPLFPQFTYATTGSSARWFARYLPLPLVHKLRWIKSYPAHPAFIAAHQHNIQSFLQKNHISERETFFLFSAHGVPQSFISKGDIYEEECQASYRSIMKNFPLALGKLCYQSQFGPEEWLKPSTLNICETINQWREGRTHIVFVPISFTSDHIETLFEIERQYMSIIKAKDLAAWRVPALTLHPLWIKAILEIIGDETVGRCNHSMLIRRN